MYTMRRTPLFEDTVVLEGDSGEKIELHVHLAITQQLLQNLRKTQVTMMQLHKAEPTEENLQKIGAALVDLLDAIFGRDNTLKMLEFFEDDFTDLSTQVVPYVMDQVIPAVTREVKARKSAYKGGKRWRN